jgi:thiol-disulfide isomerase/thioredoxin
MESHDEQQTKSFEVPPSNRRNTIRGVKPVGFTYKTTLLSFIFCLLCLPIDSISNVCAQQKNESGSDKTEIVLSKNDELTAADEKDTSAEPSKPYRKVYKVQFTQGKSYRIDLISNDFDTLLRLETSTGTQVAINDGVTPPHHNASRILFYVPKTGEYRVIATSLVPPTGHFSIQVKLANAAESAKAQLTHRLQIFAASSPDAQRKQVEETIKNLTAKGEQLTITEAHEVFELFMTIEESNDLARETGVALAKLFRGASNKQIVGLARNVDDEIAKLEKFGEELVISGKTTEGKHFDIKDLKGKIVLVDFWATWCGPCVAEIPTIVEAHKKYKAKGFEVIGVSLDRADDDIVKYLGSRDVPWKCLNSEDSNKLAEKYGVHSIPCAILIGRDGRVVSMRVRGHQLDRLLARLLEEKK